METYMLTITKNENGIDVDERSTFSEFEIMGILTHMVHIHSLKLSKELSDYEQSSRTNG